MSHLAAIADPFLGTESIHIIVSLDCRMSELLLYYITRKLTYIAVIHVYDRWFLQVTVFDRWFLQVTVFALYSCELLNQNIINAHLQ